MGTGVAGVVLEKVSLLDRQGRFVLDDDHAMLEVVNLIDVRHRLAIDATRKRAG
jgi:hypothetical protein